MVFPAAPEGADFASDGPTTAEDAVFPIDSGDTSPCIPGVVKLAPLCAHISKDLSPWPIAQIRSTIPWFLGRLINATRRTRADLASSENITEGVTRPSIMAAVRILVEQSEVARGRRCDFYPVALNDVMVTT